MACAGWALTRHTPSSAVRGGTPMAVAATTPRRAAPARRASRRRRLHALTGWLYVTPTTICVIALFVFPLLLVLRMSASHWPLLTGDQGWNFPNNYVKASKNRFFVDSITFTIKYTVLATILLLLLG